MDPRGFGEPRHPRPLSGSHRSGIKERREIIDQICGWVIGTRVLDPIEGGALPVPGLETEIIGGIVDPPLLLGLRSDLSPRRNLWPSVPIIEAR